MSTVSPPGTAPTTGYRAPGPERIFKSLCTTTGAAAAAPAHSVSAAAQPSNVFLIVISLFPLAKLLSPDGQIDSTRRCFSRGAATRDRPRADQLLVSRC